jgi:hypothetical protein
MVDTIHQSSKNKHTNETIHWAMYYNSKKLGK